MINLDNPSRKQKKIEQEHEEELLVLLGFLFLMLKKVKPLTPDSVRLAVKEWKLKYWPQVSAINEDAVLRTKKLSDTLISPAIGQERETGLSSRLNPSSSAGVAPDGTVGEPRVQSKAVAKVIESTTGAEKVAASSIGRMALEKTIKRYTSASSELLVSVIVAVEQKYKDLAVMVENYNANANQIKENIEEIVKTTETSIGRFVRLCEARNLINFIFESAVGKGYTEYRWQTEQDDRVRPTHAAVNKKWFKIGDPPKETGYYQPMEDWGCRCYPSEFR